MQKKEWERHEGDVRGRGCQGTVQITRDTNTRLCQASALSPDTHVSSLLARGPPCLPTMMSQTAHQPLSDFLRDFVTAVRKEANTGESWVEARDPVYSPVVLRQERL